MRFSRARLTDDVHRRHSVFPPGPKRSGCGDGSVKVDQVEVVRDWKAITDHPNARERR
jgi:hypothetical protein